MSTAAARSERVYKARCSATIPASCVRTRGVTRRRSLSIIRKENARCTLVTHPLGWELRLMTPDLLRSQVCRSSEEILDTHEKWKAALAEKG